MQTVVELPEFIKQAEKLLSKDEQTELVNFVSGNPLAGDVMPRCGGFRKLRWARSGTGKSGGVRVIYYVYDDVNPILLTLMYGKSEKDSLTAYQENRLAVFAADIKQSWKRD